jgi:hypothetical protein
VNSTDRMTKSETEVFQAEREQLDSLRKLSLESFLPLSRMKELGEKSSGVYPKAKPFPHIVFDDFFSPLLLDYILDEFPAPGQFAWREFNNRYEVKLFAFDDADFGPITRLLLYHLNSRTFLGFLSQMTGIANLIPDPNFDGGGMHQIVRGGKLGIHADFNKHKHYGLDRRLNLLLYLNKNWREEYGGHLEMWDREMKACEVKLLPIFNRVVIFSTTDYTYHGHPDPLQCPEDTTRKSLALYYYTNGRPAEEITGRKHSTLFQARHEGEFGAPRRSQRLRQYWRRLLRR